MVTPRLTCTPIEPIFRAVDGRSCAAASPAVQTPVRPSIGPASTPCSAERLDHHPLQSPHVLVDVVAVGAQGDDRVGDQLAGAVVGDAAAAVGVAHLDPLRSYHSAPIGSSSGVERRPRV